MDLLTVLLLENLIEGLAHGSGTNFLCVAMESKGVLSLVQHADGSSLCLRQIDKKVGRQIEEPVPLASDHWLCLGRRFPETKFLQ